MNVITPSEYLSEDDVLARWPMLSKAELRKARKANPPQITFYNFPKRSGGPCCTPQQVQEYIDRTYLKVATCKTSPDFRSENTGSTSPIPIGAEASTPADMTPELARRAAEALRQQMKRQRRSRSQLSSQPHPKPQEEAHLRLIKS